MERTEVYCKKCKRMVASNDCSKPVWCKINHKDGEWHDNIEAWLCRPRKLISKADLEQVDNIHFLIPCGNCGTELGHYRTAKVNKRTIVPSFEFWYCGKVQFKLYSNW